MVLSMPYFHFLKLPLFTPCALNNATTSEASQSQTLVLSAFVSKVQRVAALVGMTVLASSAVSSLPAQHFQL